MARSIVEIAPAAMAADLGAILRPVLGARLVQRLH